MLIVFSLSPLRIFFIFFLGPPELVFAISQAKGRLRCELPTDCNARHPGGRVLTLADVHAAATNA
jgi:hypothetical protein